MNPSITYYVNGNISSKIWKNENYKIHNENGPAFIYYNKSGNIESEYYYINDLIHREDGPAVIYYNEYGKIKSKQYYLFGKEFKTLKELQNYNKVLCLI